MADYTCIRQTLGLLFPLKVRLCASNNLQFCAVFRIHLPDTLHLENFVETTFYPESYRHTDTQTQPSVFSLFGTLFKMITVIFRKMTITMMNVMTNGREWVKTRRKRTTVAVTVSFLFFFLFNCLPYLVNKDEYIMKDWTKLSLVTGVRLFNDAI